MKPAPNGGFEDVIKVSAAPGKTAEKTKKPERKNENILLPHPFYCVWIFSRYLLGSWIAWQHNVPAARDGRLGSCNFIGSIVGHSSLRNSSFTLLSNCLSK